MIKFLTQYKVSVTPWIHDHLIRTGILRIRMLKHQLNFLTIQTCVTCVKDRSVSKQKNDPITLIRWSHTLSCPPPRVSRSSATDSGSPLSLSLPAPGPPPALTPGIAVQAPSQIWLRWMMFGNWLKVFNQKSQDFSDVLESNWSNC